MILFGMASVLLWRMTGSILIFGGGIICFVSGLLKVLWKYVVVFRKKNIWPLFVQMRIGMPLGMMIMLAGFLTACFTKDMSDFRRALLRPMPVLFVLLSVMGLAAMIRCSSRLDASDPKANWIEQTLQHSSTGCFLNGNASGLSPRIIPLSSLPAVRSMFCTADLSQ